MLLTGSFREYPFFTLLEIFLHRGETGLLEVTSPGETGYFYIKNGRVKDAQLGKNRGAAAVKLVGRCVDGSFRFKPLEPTDYARTVWQRSFGPQSQQFDPTSIPVAAARRKFGNFRSYPAAAFRSSERALASAAQGALGQFLLYPLSALQSLEKTAQLARQRVLAFIAEVFALRKRARVGTRRVRAATFGNTFGRFQSSATTALRTAEHVLVFSAQRSLRQFRLATARASHSLSNSALNLAQSTSDWATATVEFSKRARLQTRFQRLAKDVFAAWQSALRRDKRRILNYAHQFTFQNPLPAPPNRAAIAASLHRAAKSNITFTLIVCVLSLAIVLTLNQLIRDDQVSVGSGTIDENFDTGSSSAKVAPRAKPKPRRGKRKVRDKKPDTSAEQ